MAVEGLVSAITDESSTGRGRAAPIQIRAQVLQQGQYLAPLDDVFGLAMMTDEAGKGLSDERPSRTGRWRQADVKRAISAAERAGLRRYRVEIAPDGTISIVVGMDPEGEEPEDETSAA